MQTYEPTSVNYKEELRILLSNKFPVFLIGVSACVVATALILGLIGPSIQHNIVLNDAMTSVKNQVPSPKVPDMTKFFAFANSFYLAQEPQEAMSAEAIASIEAELEATGSAFTNEDENKDESVIQKIAASLNIQLDGSKNSTMTELVDEATGTGSVTTNESESTGTADIEELMANAKTDTQVEEGYFSSLWQKIASSAAAIVQRPQETQLKQETSRVYVVKEGDTLWDIAENQYKDGELYAKIASVNQLAQPDTLEVGQKITLPDLNVKDKTSASGEITPDAAHTIRVSEYTVKEGDTLWSISLSIYGDGYAWTKIAAYNELANPDLIVPGQVLKIPPVVQQK